MPEEPLSIEIKSHVVGVDAIMSKIVKDRTKWKEFFHNPAKVLGEMGFRRPVSDENAWRYNKMFYALLTDQELLQYVRHASVQPNMNAQQVDAFYDSLKGGKIEFDPEIDVDIMSRLKNNPAAFRILLKLSLHRINDEKIFTQQYTEDEIERCIDAVLDNAKENSSLSEMVKAMPWHAETDEEFQVMAVIPPAIAVPVVAEAVACGTLACVVVPMAEAGVAKQSLETLQFAAFRSDRDSIRALTILGLLLEFIGEMADHVNEFERILRK
jgi:hypothetical protein